MSYMIEPNVILSLVDVPPCKLKVPSFLTVPLFIQVVVVSAIELFVNTVPVATSIVP